MPPGRAGRNDAAHSVRNRPFVLLIGFQRFNQPVLVGIDRFVLIRVRATFSRRVQWFLLIGFAVTGILSGFMTRR
ncbi:hypothetical protein BGC31_09815 [Komagataeibacter xylinus]|nr:hypothetical protein BGC31_09815 [Komagataeibacter xylinus]